MAGLETVLHASYKRRGQYADQLERLFDRFPRDKLIVVWSANLFARPGGTMESVFESRIACRHEEFELRGQERCDTSISGLA